MKKILIVDDDADILDVVKHILLSNDFEVEATSKWQNIEQVIQSYNPDLILLDILLQGADGREICNEIKEYRDIPIILFSADSHSINRLEGIKANAIVRKPFDTNNLIKTITMTLNENFTLQ